MMGLTLPRQGAINRGKLVPPYVSGRTPLRNPDGSLDGYRDEVDEFGGLPGDPPHWQRWQDAHDPMSAGALLGALLGLR